MNAYPNLQFLSVFESRCFQVFLPDDFDHCILQLLLECKVLPRGIQLIDQLLSPARVNKIQKKNNVFHFFINEILFQTLAFVLFPDIEDVYSLQRQFIWGFV